MDPHQSPSNGWGSTPPRGRGSGRVRWNRAPVTFNVAPPPAHQQSTSANWHVVTPLPPTSWTLGDSPDPNVIRQPCLPSYTHRHPYSRGGGTMPPSQNAAAGVPTNVALVRPNCWTSPNGAMPHFGSTSSSSASSSSWRRHGRHPQDAGQSPRHPQPPDTAAKVTNGVVPTGKNDHSTNCTNGRVAWLQPVAAAVVVTHDVEPGGSNHLAQTPASSSSTDVAQQSSSTGGGAVADDEKEETATAAVNNSDSSCWSSPNGTTAAAHLGSSLATGGSPPVVAAEHDDPWLCAMKEMDEQNKLVKKIGLVVQGRYEILLKLSFGSYGMIYVAKDLHDPSRRQLALKLESQENLKDKAHLKYESTVYNVLSGLEGIPAVYWFGEEYGNNILVMDLLGPSLEQLFNFCQRQFSLKTICLIGKQMVLRLKAVHSRGFIHRDIKPENFLIGLNGNETIVYLIDFGLARRYRFRDKQTGNLRHIPFKSGKNLVGTARYASINSHQGKELSRRDDLESLAYILIGFLLGELPWKEPFHKARYRTKKQAYKRIQDMKVNSSAESLCRNVPRQFGVFLRHCRELDFTAEPDYDHLLALLDAVLVDNRLSAASVGTPQDYDWVALRADPEKRFSYECGFKWTLPPGTEPVAPSSGCGGFMGFGGGGAGGFAPPAVLPPEMPPGPNQQPNNHVKASSSFCAAGGRRGRGYSNSFVR